jgi:hypothetical protein
MHHFMIFYDKKSTNNTEMDRGNIIVYVVIAFVLVICLHMYYNSDWIQLKCIVSTVDGKKYCVRDRSKLKESADLLANTTSKCKQLVAYMKDKYPDNDVVKRLVAGYNPHKIMETLPNSEHTAYSQNKGEKIAFCLNPSKEKHDHDNLIDDHTLMFVAIHELSHVCTKSVGHKQEFWDNFKFLLNNAKEAGIHYPKDYKKKPTKYCGMTIHDNPYYDA